MRTINNYCLIKINGYYNFKLNNRVSRGTQSCSFEKPIFYSLTYYSSSSSYGYTEYAIHLTICRLHLIARLSTNIIKLVELLLFFYCPFIFKMVAQGTYNTD
jgi:hypothetical protein